MRGKGGARVSQSQVQQHEKGERLKEEHGLN